ncbi:MAG: FAD:protein FMN transferase [Verrucomicrobiota bacterium]
MVKGRAMGTEWWIRYEAEAEPGKVEKQVAQRLEELEKVFSTYRSDSELTRFNRTESTDWITVSPEMVWVAYHSRRVSELTEGTFDPTVAPLVTLWGFGPQGVANRMPDEVQIKAAQELVDYRRLDVRLESPALRKTVAALKADFSSMAKGYAADQISELLVSMGVASHLLAIGGDIKSRGRETSMGLSTPTAEPSGSTAAVVRLKGEQAVSTAGNYRTVVMYGRKRYGHIVDPRTGRPVDSAVLSVSVVHTSCAYSSALATGLYVLGLEKGMRLARSEGLAVMFIMREGERMVVRATPEFEKSR